METAAASPVGPTAEATVPVSAAPEQAAAEGWQTYTNTEAGFSVRYPPNWSLTPSPPSTPEPMMNVDVLEGPEGRIELQWGSGFGGACSAYSALHLAQGQIPACHYVAPDGAQNWSLTSVKLPTVGVAGFAATKDAEPASADVVLAILATLAFEAPENLGTAAATAAPGQPQELVADNAAASFWPKGNWYFLATGQQYGKDCYVALPGLDTAAEVRPGLPEAGPFEVFADGAAIRMTTKPATGSSRCTDRLTTRRRRPWASTTGPTPASGRASTAVTHPGAYLNVKSVLDGRVVADAFRFVYRSPAAAEVVPTPCPPGLSSRAIHRRHYAGDSGDLGAPGPGRSVLRFSAHDRDAADL